MQSALSLGNAVFRLVFRGGSPQRIQYSDRLLVGSLLAFILLAILSQLSFFRSSIIEVGLFLFTCLAGLYIGLALLTRKVPRVRLRPSQLAALLLLAASQLLLVLLSLVAREPAELRHVLTAAVLLALIVGGTNILRYALATSLSAAALISCAFVCALVAFYTTLAALLETLYS